MSATLDHPVSAPSTDEHASHGEHHHPGFFGTYIWTHDHKMIGKQYLFTSMFFGAISGLLAMVDALATGIPRHADAH